ncbi:hypothetical protein ACIP93_32395 [Streptomyces sp. NPDC088745]|uniref:hypothetical protein n=1 Tax=Streptomyces sp. NPDC088745 TaxID=3365884 RepID=UPI0038137C57
MSETETESFEEVFASEGIGVPADGRTDPLASAHRRSWGSSAGAGSSAVSGLGGRSRG